MAELAIPNLKQVRGLKDLPAVRQLALLIGLALAVAAGVALFTWSQQPDYVPVYPGLSDKDASEVAEALRGAGLPYRLDPSGSVTVPGDKVYQARMRLASQGLPKGTAMGYEMIQQDQGLGTSQFIESARYQLALETELARTVSSLQPVKSARVHLAMPKASPFVRRGDSPSASVLVELYPGRQLEPGQVSSIVHIVASSVPDLVPGAVTVIDQYGHLLSGDSDGEAAQSARQFDETHRLEADYTRRIEQLLTPMLGAGRISAQVAADMDFSETEQAQETYKPDGAALRSEQVSEEISRNGSGGAAQGIPGATSNQPPAAVKPAAPAAAAAAAATAPGAAPAVAPATAAPEQPTSQTRNSTRNYELDRTVSHTRQPVGRLRRLSVAVLVDNLPQTDPKTRKTTLQPLSQQQLDKVTALVKEAVGFDASRGDTLSVQNAPFASTEAPELAPLPLWQRPELRDIARQGFGGLMVLALILVVLRPLLRNIMSPARHAAAALPGAELGEERLSLGGASTAGALPGPYEQKIAAARSAVSQDPKRVAQVVKTWLGEDG